MKKDINNFEVFDLIGSIACDFGSVKKGQMTEEQFEHCFIGRCFGLLQGDIRHLNEMFNPREDEEY